MEKEKRLIKLKPKVHQELLGMATRRDVAIGDVIEYLLESWERLRVFDDIPCKYCGKPLTNWRNNEVRKAFRNWYHVGCEPEK